jgi:hypothetical protein
MSESATNQTDIARELLEELWHSLGGPAKFASQAEITGIGSLPSAFAVTELAAAAIGVAGLAVAELIAMRHGIRSPVRIDRRLSSMWFAVSLRPEGWRLPPVWDAIAGDYRAADGWIKLHTNAPRHREAA